MMAVVTSIGEPTTDLCVWSLERQGYTVRVYEDARTSLGQKLQMIYDYVNDDFIRVDADVIVNRNVPKLTEYEPEAWWIQGLTYSWYSQDIVWGGVQYIRKAAIPALRQGIVDHVYDERPETAMSRIPQLYNPRRFESVQVVCGLHGWAQTDLDRVKATKSRRKQSDNYDWELVERMAQL